MKKFQNEMRSTRRQGLYWICTIPWQAFTPWLPRGVSYLKGQLESGSTTGYTHWQLLVILSRKGSLRTMQDIFGETGHYELTRTEAASDYCWKEDTRIEGTQFELGIKPIRRNCSADWERVWDMAVNGRLLEIEPAIRLQHYRTLRTISSDYAQPVGIERTCHVFFGTTGTGKSRRAWSEAGLAAYPKDPRTKFWDGYQGQVSVVIDEFRGGIDISHLLRWLDRYPVLVEIKGSSTPLVATTIWITSNLHPRDWYPALDSETYQALERRLQVTQFQ